MAGRVQKDVCLAESEFEEGNFANVCIRRGPGVAQNTKDLKEEIVRKRGSLKRRKRFFIPSREEPRVPLGAITKEWEALGYQTSQKVLNEKALRETSLLPAIQRSRANP